VRVDAQQPSGSLDPSQEPNRFHRFSIRPAASCAVKSLQIGTIGAHPRHHNQPETDVVMEKPTQDQLEELKRLSKIARVPDESEIVTSKQEAEVRIRDLKEKARME
jgi:hypothetical protein